MSRITARRDLTAWRPMGSSICNVCSSECELGPVLEGSLSTADKIPFGLSQDRTHDLRHRRRALYHCATSTWATSNSSGTNSQQRNTCSCFLHSIVVKVFDLGATGHGFNPRLRPSFKVLQNIGKQFFCKSHLNSVHAYWLDAGATGPLPSCLPAAEHAGL